jgi:hypothetical protein
MMKLNLFLRDGMEVGCVTNISDANLLASSSVQSKPNVKDYVTYGEGRWGCTKLISAPGKNIHRTY